jgi:glyoxylase-like metal-dependent hydrolase (beta-lactamase superfamily II)
LAKKKSKMTIHTLDLNFINQAETVASFLVEMDNALALVETGPHSTFPLLKQKIEAKGFKIEDIKHVFLSHIHFDHAGAAWCFAPHATIYVHPVGEKHLTDPSKLYTSAQQIYGDKMEFLWGKMEGIAPEKLHATQHGEVIKVGDKRVTAWHTPGHASHHIAWQIDDILFTGDVGGVKIGNGIVVPPCPPPDIDIEAWQNSIALIKSLKVNVLYLTHFGKVTEVEDCLNQLESRLLSYSAWIKPHFEAGKTVEEVTPLYQAMVKTDMAEHGITGSFYERYEAANPSGMSVAGLMRYWKKKG